MPTPTFPVPPPDGPSVAEAIDAFRSDDVRVNTVKGLADLDRAGQRDLAAAWPELSQTIRRRLTRQMGKLGEQRVELNFDRALDIALDDEVDEIRRLAVIALWECATPAHLVRVTGLAESDPSLDVRIEATRALGRFAARCAQGELDESEAAQFRSLLLRLIAAQDQSVEVRAAALASIGPFGGAEVRQLIVEAYRSDEPALQQAAIVAMGRSMEGRWLDSLVEELERGDQDERQIAADAIGELGDPRAVAELAKAGGDLASGVRRAAILALGKIGGGAAAKALRQLEGANERDRELIDAALSSALGDQLPF